MSNLNMHNVDSFDSASQFLGRQSSRTLCFATTLDRETVAGEHGVMAIAVRHHGSPIIRYFSDGCIEIRNAGWMSRTTTNRLHSMTPFDVRVSGAKGGSVTSPLYTGAQPHDFTRVV